MKQGWKIVKLPDVVYFQEGPGLRKYQYREKGIPFLNIRTLQNEKVNISLCGFLDENEVLNNYSHFLLNENEIVCSSSGTIGKTAIISKEDLPLMLNTSIIRFRSLNTEILCNKYIYYYLKSKMFIQQAIENAKGQAQVNIGPTHLKTFDFILPPLPEQERIVSILDKAFSAIDQAKQNAEKNLKNAKELFDSYLNNIFTNKGDDWEEKTLKEISIDFGRGKSKHRPRNDKILYDGKYPFIQTGDIRNCNHYITNYTQTYNEIGLAQSKLWKKGTICITIAANIAETGILTFDGCFPDSIIGLYVNEKISDSLFVEYLLQFFKTQIQSLSKGSAQANINMQTFENKKFPFPSLLEQQAIVQKLDALSAETKKLEEIYQQKITELEELKKSVLQKAFNGELI